MAKTLVTGGTGFLGSHVVKELAARGDQLEPGRGVIAERLRLPGRKAQIAAGESLTQLSGDLLGCRPVAYALRFAATVVVDENPPRALVKPDRDAHEWPILPSSS